MKKGSVPSRTSGYFKGNINDGKDGPLIRSDTILGKNDRLVK